MPGPDGKGAAKTAIPSMDNVADIRDAKNVLNKNGRWENILGSTTISTGGPTANSSLYPYFFHSTSVPVTTTTVLLAAGLIGGVGKLRDMTNSTDLVTLTAGGNPMSFETVKEKCYFSDGATKPQVIDGQNGMAVYTWGIGPGPGAGFGSIQVSYDPGFTISTLTFTCTPGTALITVDGGSGSVPSGAFPNGMTVWLNGDENTAPANRHFVTDFTPGGSGVGTLTIDPVPTAAELGTTGTTTVHNITSQLNYGNMTWTQGGPKYAASFYDSTRGHSGNIGDIVQPPEAAKYNVNLQITLAGDNTQDRSRCDQLILWTTPAFAIGGNFYTLNTTSNTAGPHVINDQRLDDSSIGVVLGPFLAPQQTNNPPKTFSYVAYWNGVMWGLGPTGPNASDFDLSLLYFSRQDDPSLIGRGEESWPLYNFMRIPAKDGRGTGLVVIGDSLCVLTERYIYAVSGSSDGSYRLVQLSSRGFGVGQFQMAEYTGDSTKSTAAMIFVGQDRMTWAQALGDTPVYLSSQVQDQLDSALRGPTNAALYPNVRVHYLTYSGDTYAVLLLN